MTLRDLLFHVQEHRFTIPKIKDCLAQLGLTFCGFEADKKVQKFKSEYLSKMLFMISINGMLLRKKIRENFEVCTSFGVKR